jgi:biopolymer transport protein ExbD
VEREAQPIVITISPQGSYRVNGRALVNNERSTLSAALRQVAGSGRQDPVTIRADARATHQSVVTAMDVAAKQGFTQVNIATVSQQAEE